MPDLDLITDIARAVGDHQAVRHLRAVWVMICNLIGFDGG